MSTATVAAAAPAKSAVSSKSKYYAVLALVSLVVSVGYWKLIGILK